MRFRLASVLRPNLLEGHFSFQLHIERYGYFAQSTSRMVAEQHPGLRSGLVFPTTQGTLHKGTPLHEVLKDACKAAGVKLDYVLEIDVPFEAIIERMSGRRSHPAQLRILC